MRTDSFLDATIVLINEASGRPRFCKYHNIKNTDRAKYVFWKFAEVLAGKEKLLLHHINYYSRETGEFVNQAKQPVQ